VPEQRKANSTDPAKKKQRPKLGPYLKPRDIDVVETLWRYRIARESTLHRRCFPTVVHQRKVQARLKQLCEEGYLNRRFPPIVHPDNKGFTDYIHQDRRQVIYWVERRGAEELLSDQPFDNDGRERLQSIRSLSEWSEYRLNHWLDLSDIRACLELAVEKTPGVHLADWYDEHDKNEQELILKVKVKIPYGDADRERPFTLCPDACFILEDEHSPKQDLFFVEIDEGTESARKRWHDKVLAYLAYLEHGFEEDFEFKGEEFRVLTITRGQRDKDHPKRKQVLLKTTFNAEGRGRFWFATFEEVMPGDTITGEHFLAGKIWQRARREEIEKKVGLALREHLFI